VFQSRVLRRIFGPMRDEMTGGWRKLSILRIIKSRRMRWARHVALMKRRGMHIAFW
jgi:hypothetical protein